MVVSTHVNFQSIVINVSDVVVSKVPIESNRECKFKEHKLTFMSPKTKGENQKRT